MRTPFNSKFLILLCFFYIVAVGISGCDWFSSSPDGNSPKLLWKSKIYATGAVDGRFPNVLFEDKVFITMEQVAEYETKLVGLDIQTGKHLWEWHDNFIEKEAGDFRSSVRFGNKIVFAIGGRHYCIDAITGKTEWRSRVDYSTSSILTSFRNKYFFSGTIPTS